MRVNLPISTRLFSFGKTLLLAAVLLGFGLKGTAQCTGPVSGNFTINKHLPTAGNNFQSFTEAVFSLACGVSGPVVFNVAENSGPYEEQVVINQISGASATSTITFNCNGTTLQFVSNNTALPAGVQLDGADHIIFDSLKIVPLTTGLVDYEWGYGVKMIRNADSNIIRKCTILIPNNNRNPQNSEGIVINGADAEANGLGASYCDGNIISGNYISGGYGGISFSSFTGYGAPVVLMNNNKIINNRITNTVYTSINLIYCNNTLVQGNDLDIPAGNTISQAIELNELNTNTLIDGNRIHRYATNTVTTTNLKRGINVPYCRALPGQENIISNNIFYNFNMPGEQQAISLNAASYVNIVHNTIALDDTSTSTRPITGIYMEGATTNIKIYNNIITIRRGGTGRKIGIDVTAATIGFVSDYNDIYVNAAAGTTNVVGRRASTTYLTLFDWQAATGKDQNSVSTDPLYVNPAAVNFEPTAIPVDDLGLFAGITTDINGNTRSTASPDPGAYEFGAAIAPCGTPPTAGISVGLPATVFCAGTNVTLKLNGNSIGGTQTYQWQSADTEFGTYTYLSGVQNTPAYAFVPTSTKYYRAEIICGSSTVYSVPVKITVNNVLPGGTYSINSMQVTGGTNFATFAEALASMNCGISGPIVFKVAPASGPYNEQLIIGPVTGASATNTITFNGRGEELNYLSTNTNERAVIKLNGADHFIFDSLKIVALGSATNHFGYGVQFIADADSNVIKNCNIIASSTLTTNIVGGIIMSGSATSPVNEGTTACDYNIIDNNTITGGFYGITMVANTAPENAIRNNRITNNTIKDFYSYGMYVTGHNGLVIEGNDVSRPSRTNSNSTVTAIGMVTKSENVTISKNKVHNLFDAMVTNSALIYAFYTSGCDATDSTVNTISNNIVYNFNGAGQQYGLYNSSSDYVRYFHNTINMDDGTSNSTQFTRGFYQTTLATGIKFRNNIISITRLSSGVATCIYTATNTTTYESDYNDYYLGGSGTGAKYIGYRSSNIATLAAWRTAALKDSNSLAENPSFNNPAFGDLKPVTDAIDNKGRPVGITTDILNAARSTTTPDMGAYEFNGPALPVTLLSVSATRIAADVVVNWTTATELNTKAFNIERSFDGVNFTAAGAVQAKGNSTTITRYAFTDAGVAQNTSLKIIYYRIKMYDKDGSFTYSNTVAVKLDKKTAEAVFIYPNPFVDLLFARITAATNGKAEIAVTDASGKTLLRQLQTVQAGTTLVPVTGAASLSAGVYLVTVHINGSKFVSKVIR